MLLSVMPVPDQVRHDGSGIQQRNVEENTGFPFDFAQGGEPVEPRVKPGMTKQQYLSFCQLRYSLVHRNLMLRTVSIGEQVEKPNNTGQFGTLGFDVAFNNFLMDFATYFKVRGSEVQRFRVSISAFRIPNSTINLEP
jgi:hypothetical protein